MNNYQSTVRDIPVERKSYKNSSLRFLIPKHVHIICLAPSSPAFRGTFLFKRSRNLLSFLFLYRYAFYPPNLYCSLIDHFNIFYVKVFNSNSPSINYYYYYPPPPSSSSSSSPPPPPPPSQAVQSLIAHDSQYKLPPFPITFGHCLLVFSPIILKPYHTSSLCLLRSSPRFRIPSIPAFGICFGIPWFCILST